jgi:uncharacterized oligopeptide transporter (OPT) family protein
MTGTNEDAEDHTPKGAAEHRLTVRSLIAGGAFGTFMCAVNTYLTLRFGIIEEGPMIAAIFFFSAVYFATVFAHVVSRIMEGVSRTVATARGEIEVQPVTTAEMVIVATMGSAGGSLAFIANFFAAKAMTSEPYTTLEMFLFAVVSGTIGVLSVIAFRHLLVVKDEELPEDQRLPWIGARAVKGVIDPFLARSDPRQPRYLAIFTTLAACFVLLNSSGVGLLPEKIEIGIFGLSAFGAGVLLAPFAVGSAFFMGFRTVTGFFLGGVTLVAIAPLLPSEIQSSPHQYLWPGVMFLVTSGLTALVLRWRVIVEAFASLGRANTESVADDDPIMGARTTVIFALGAITFSVAILVFVFDLPLHIVIVMIILGGGVLNLIATRAYAQTYFNPVRVMGVLLQGISASLGGASVGTNLTASGFIAGSGTQSSNLTCDTVYGRQYGVPSRWQFWAQAVTVVTAAAASALTFAFINRTTPLTFESEALAAPAAKMWAVIGLLFDPASNRELPPFAVQSMFIGGVVGILWAILEDSDRLRRFVPGSIGFGMGLVISPAIDFAFFIGGIIMLFILRKLFKVSDATLATLAIGGIVGEGIGGLSQGVLKAIGIIG